MPFCDRYGFVEGITAAPIERRKKRRPDPVRFGPKHRSLLSQSSLSLSAACARASAATTAPAAMPGSASATALPASRSPSGSSG